MSSVEMIKAAAHRVRTGDYSGIQGINDRSLMPGIDLRLLALAWLADHPADDDEPATSEWLQAVGLVSEGGESVDIEAALQRFFARPEEAKDGDPINRTRGELRRLMKALSIPIKESAK
ncbi:hypothetical protein [Zavarzinella formosa]|uniref:hypothetical protein n=1 Tax=Zavarzinella formosa TaxID=360055 RepID=UPI0002EF5683|nr:hypothetical protein [Zavarzinella formosa]